MIKGSLPAERLAMTAVAVTGGVQHRQNTAYRNECMQRRHLRLAAGRRRRQPRDGVERRRKVLEARQSGQVRDTLDRRHLAVVRQELQRERTTAVCHTSAWSTG